MVGGIAVFLGCLMPGCVGESADSELVSQSTPMYLGQQPPGETPEPFAPGIVNTDAIELNGVFSPDGREFFFTRVIVRNPDEREHGFRAKLNKDSGAS